MEGICPQKSLRVKVPSAILILEGASFWYLSLKTHTIPIFNLQSLELGTTDSFRCASYTKVFLKSRRKRTLKLGPVGNFQKAIKRLKIICWVSDLQNHQKPPAGIFWPWQWLVGMLTLLAPAPRATFCLIKSHFSFRNTTIHFVFCEIIWIKKKMYKLVSVIWICNFFIFRKRLSRE